MPTIGTANTQIQTLQKENGRLRRAVEELSILNELARNIGASHDVQQIIHTIIRGSLKALRAEQGVITLVGEEASDPTQTLIRTTASSGDHESFHPEQSLLGWMHLHKAPLLVNDPGNDPRFKGTDWNTAIRSILCVPLIVHARLTGILTLYNKKTPGGFTTEDQRLQSILAAQSAQIIENARLHVDALKLQRLQEEHRLAFEIQTNLLPRDCPDFPGYDLAGSSHPASSVGGDYFDFISMDDHRLALCVGDVSGKGIPAALLMSNLQATLRGQTLVVGDTITTCIEHTNRLLCQRIRKGSFVTLFYGVLNNRTHRFQYVNAGHNRPLLFTADGRIKELSSSGLVLGFKPDFAYAASELILNPGDTLLIYSDGVCEAMNLQREQYGTDRIVELFRAHQDKPVSKLIEHIHMSVQRHTGAAEQSDDITFLAVRRHPN